MTSYLRHAQPRGDLARAALRSRSPDLREVFAEHATAGRLGYDALLAAATQDPTGTAEQADPRWIASLARVVALQELTEADLEAARMLFSLVPTRRLGGQEAATYARLLLRLGEREQLRELLDTAGRELTADDAFLHANIANPALGSPAAEGRRWARQISRALAQRGLTDVGVQVRPGVPPFDTVHSVRTPPPREGGPLISVVMTAYRPGEAFERSVRSILDQTWRNLEIIVVDDCSGPDHAALFARVEGLDPRIQVVRQEVNGGTYLARNAALAVARGEFVTGQDDDDWAHPTRLERQVAPLLADATLPATLSCAVWASEDLEVSPLGWPSVGKYAPSFMVRRELVLQAGRYLPARKGADTELIRRVEAMTGQQTMQLPEALSLYRTRPGSLSRDDFSPGWDHPARTAFWHLSYEVHDRIRAGQIRAEEALGRIAVPQRFLTAPAHREHYDVLLVANLRADASTGAAWTAAQEVLAVQGSGRRAALVHLHDVREDKGSRAVMDPHVMRLVNARELELLYLDSPVDADLLVVRQGGIMQYAPPGASTLGAEDVVLVADEAPGLAGAPGGFDLVACSEHATRVFGRAPRWVGEDPQLRQRARAAAVSGGAGHVPVVHDVLYRELVGLGEPDEPARATGGSAGVVGVLGPVGPDTVAACEAILRDAGPEVVLRVRAQRLALQASGLSELVDAQAGSGRVEVVDPAAAPLPEFLDQVGVALHYPPPGRPAPWLPWAPRVLSHPSFRFGAAGREQVEQAWPAHAGAALRG